MYKKDTNIVKYTKKRDQRIKRIPLDAIKIEYRYEDGLLIRNKTNRAVGWNSHGYLAFDFRGEKYLVHRVIYALHFGDTPNIIDHINRVKDDNRIENLRESNKSLNGLNKGLRKDNKSGVSGVTRCKWTGGWEIRYKGKGYGRRKSLEEAIILRESLESSEDFNILTGQRYANIH